SPMAQRYQAAQLAAAPRAVSTVSSQTTVGPETTVSGPGLRADAASRIFVTSGIQDAKRSRGTQAGIQPSASSAATRTACGPMAAIQMGRSGTAGWPSRSGCALE